MTIAENVAAAREAIAAACARVGRAPGEVRVLAAGKTQPVAAIQEAIRAGVDAIGENRVQEAAAKRSLVGSTAPWHLIGPLQRNKAKAALELFDLVETVDRVELADRLETLLAATGRTLPVFLEINIGAEPQKSGVPLAAAPELAEHLTLHCPHLRLDGVMTIPPWDPDPERARPHFARLRQLGAELKRRYPERRIELSMGMSEDFAIAVEEGATLVRLGRALFGERVTST